MLESPLRPDPGFNGALKGVISTSNVLVDEVLVDERSISDPSKPVTKNQIPPITDAN